MTFCLVIAAAACAALPSCTGRGSTSDLHVLEELEAASNVQDPGERVERLMIFTRNHPAHPYRVQGHQRIFETIAGDLADPRRASDYMDGVLASEREERIRGDLWYRRFAYLWDADRARAVSLARELCDGEERYYRLFFYLALYLMEEQQQAGLAERCFTRSIELAPPGEEHAQVLGEYGVFLEGRGRTDEALAALRKATSYGFANETLGNILWERNEREEAIEAFVRLAALVPGAADRVGVDSLYSIVHPGGEDFHERIMDYRVGDGGLVPDEEFVDIEGRRYALHDYRGSPLVLIAFSPT
jgi:tetratricopeptide (TPR) repeat protein